MFQEKILVTPGLVARVEVITKRIARRFGGLVPVNDIFFERIVRRQVEPATEPPDRITVIPGREKAKIRVRCWDVGIQWMDNERHTDSLETTAREIRPAFGRGGRQFVTEHMRKPHAGLFEYRAVTEDTSSAHHHHPVAASYRA